MDSATTMFSGPEVAFFSAFRSPATVDLGKQLNGLFGGTAAVDAEKALDEVRLCKYDDASGVCKPVPLPLPE